MKLKEMADRAKNALIRDDSAVDVVDAPEKPILQPNTACLNPQQLAQVAPVSALPANSQFYDRVAAATDYTSDPNVQKLLNGAKRLEPLIPDRNLRMKAVLAQSEISVEAVIAAVDAAIKALTGERYKFEQSLNGGRQQLEKQKAEAQELESKWNALRDSIQNAQNKLSSAAADFNVADAKRETELKAARAEFVALK